MSTRFPNEQFGSPAEAVEPDPRPYRKRGYFVASLPGVVDRLKTAAVGFFWAVVLVAGAIILALCALDLMDALRW